MASNALPKTSGQLIQLGNNMLSGLNVLGATLKITQITPAQFQADLVAFVNADNDFNKARSAEQEASDAVNAAVANIGDWLGVVRGVLTGSFGAFWNTMWAQAGFIDHSTAVPAKADDRIALAARLTAFFTAQPSYQVASLEVTAAKGTALGAAVQGAKQTLAAKEVAIKSIGQTWDGAYAALVAVMRALIKILGATLADDDPRWLTFGLKMPATNSTPGQPVNLSAHTDDTGAIVVQCDAVPLATRYRWRMLLVGVETDYTLAASSPVPIGTIAGVEPGRLVQIIVQAVNGGLQGVASEPLSFRMPPAQTPEGKAPVESPAPAGDGHAETLTNGNGNGNGKAHRAASRLG